MIEETYTPTVIRRGSSYFPARINDRTGEVIERPLHVAIYPNPGFTYEASAMDLAIPFAEQKDDWIERQVS